jgi:hypothetical protein
LADEDAQRPIFGAGDVGGVHTMSDGNVVPHAALGRQRESEATRGRHIALPETVE